MNPYWSFRKWPEGCIIEPSSPPPSRSTGCCKMNFYGNCKGDPIKCKNPDDCPGNCASTKCCMQATNEGAVDCRCDGYDYKDK